MSQYFNTFILIEGFFIAFLSSCFIYLDLLPIRTQALQTLLAVLFFYLLLKASARVWFWSGFFIGIFWFWWIALSFIHYQMSWAMPFAILAIGLVYGMLFWLIAKIAFSVKRLAPHSGQTHGSVPTLFALSIKSLGLLTLSYIHPLGFDWFKPELVFIHSYLGVHKWQFALILLSIVLSLWRKKLYYLLLALLAFSSFKPMKYPTSPLALVATHISIEEKWDTALHPKQFAQAMNSIDRAIEQNKTLVILPESIFPVFLNRQPTLIEALKKRAKKINIVTGALYWDGESPKNSTYIFTRDGNVTIANKVVLVPFGERNPLPDFLSHWVNKIFYDDAVDYTADKHVTDYTIDGITYRNAICFEATSEKLYEGNPKQMIVLSNNGWFTPSTEPTLQKLLLQYYSRKYGTTIYHAVNMSPSYIIMQGQVTQEKQ